LSDWIGAHCRAFAFFGGVPAQVVCDNLKSGVTKACFHEPLIDRTYADIAEHYGTAVVPARTWKPCDKATVEVPVQIAERWIAARLRNQQFFSLSELNAAIRVLLDRLNDRVTRPLCSGRITGLHRSYGSVRPSVPHRYARLAVNAACASPLASERLVPAVPHETPDQIHAPYKSVAARPVAKYPVG
jgi:hypothetical protein